MADPAAAATLAPGERAAGARHPAASVIIVARDRRRDLEAALAALAAQRLQGASFEVLVVDDGSGDGTWEMLAARSESGAAAGEGASLRALRHERSVGPGAARNGAARAASGDVLVFLDSDCVPHAGWLEAMLAPLRDPAVGAVGGAEVLDPSEPALARAFHFVLTSGLTTGGIRGRAGRRAGRYRPRTFSLALRRDAFERAGGFAGLRNGEDIDLSLRVARLGLGLVYAPEARVFHRRRRTVGAFVRQCFAMGRARTTLIRRDRGHAEPVYFLPALALLGTIGLAIAATLSAAARPVAVAAAAGAGLYLAGVLLAGARALASPGPALLAPLAFVVQQAAYGAGFLHGIARPFREEPRPAS